MTTMTFEKLAKLVADEFNTMVEEDEFNNFSELRRANCWEMIDIKDEVSNIITDICNNEYEAVKKEFGKEAAYRLASYFMWDDLSTIQIGFDEMSWGNFKKLIFSNVK